MKIEIFLVICIFLITTPAYAEFTGLELMHTCDGAITATNNQNNNIPITNLEGQQMLACYSFLTGVIQGYKASFAFTYKAHYPTEIKNKAIRENMFCFPEDQNIPSTEQIARIVLKELQNHPENLNISAGILVYGILLKTFPCK